MIELDLLERPGETEMPAASLKPAARTTRRTPPPCPDYGDEISREQHDAIRKLADSVGDDSKRTLLHAPAW